RVTLTRTQVRSLLDRHGVRPKRSLGQNFVVEPNTVRRIVELAEIGQGDRVVEIGPGVGSLTLALLEEGASVTAVEVDDVLIGLLAEVTKAFTPDQVRIVHADAMEVDWAGLLSRGSWSLVANLPYNISVPLICDLLDDVPVIEKMVVMVQREVADRLVARPGDDAYGLPSVKVAYHAEARLLGRVPPSVFLPRPRVDSALIGLWRRLDPATTVDREVLFGLVRAGFGQRRKMLRRSLKGLLDEVAIVESGVDPTARAEELGLDQWASLASRVVGHGP
ncbi:MAG: 16S rRNA (adenine(1518)-N(6)/adenine(1519)-N(6))-dimethyltransferase RsmA, partial [Acidimicrobiales bacterium]|nr:16S rRNA (adenine(1518)-N(6)/adenine(1519)-N(6))-dimethyltransferase RsmA [Acidimicrobiales bacterium]